LIPLRHTSPRQTTPFVNRGLVACNVAVFVIQFFMGNDAESLIRTFGFVPMRLLDPAAFGYARWEVLITLVTSLFLHGGFVHLLGNMIYLWVFGDAVEDSFGHGQYLAFYLGCGMIGSLTHTFFFPASPIPSVGASGSIAGVLGAFFVLRPRARIVTLFPLVIYWAMAEVRAALFLPVWFAMQFFSGFLSLASARGTQEVSGVAWWAHVGGFAFGAAFAFFFKRMNRKRTMQPA
jgi:membrane associated rhomboid family serine protease